MTNQKRIVFISYSHVDTDFVNRFASLLLDFDIQIWKDSKDLKVGGEILESIYEAIKNTSHFCCIISSSSVKSAWVEAELSYAKDRRLEGVDLAIIPILIDKVDIPDYIKDYKYADLQDRNLSLKNQEVTLTLQAFGVNIQEAPRIITDQERKLLLRSCVALRERIIHFRQKLESFQKCYEAYQKAKLVSRHIRVRDDTSVRRGIGSRSRKGSGYKYVLNPAYFKIKTERDHAKSAIIDLRESASWLPDPIKMVKQALKAAGLSMSGSPKEKLSSSKTYLWVSLDDALGLASAMSKTISKVSRDEDDSNDEDDEDSDWGREDGWDQLKGLGWVREIPRWITSISKIVAALDRAIGTLDYWGRFDSDKLNESRSGV